VGALARARRYEAAGALLLVRNGTHPALCSTSAKLAALRQFVEARAAEIEAGAAHPLRALWETMG